MGDFDLDTRVEGGNGHYRAHISRDWEIWGPNGGYLAAIALRAAGREACPEPSPRASPERGDSDSGSAAVPHPASFTCHFLATARFEPVHLEVGVLHRGRRSQSLHVVMRQDSRPILQALVRTAAQGPGLEHDVAIAPEVPDPEALKSWEELKPDAPESYPFWKNVEGKVSHPERIDDPGSYEPVLREWYRFRPRATFDDVWVDAGRLLLLIDTLSWPAACMPHPWPRQYQGPNLDVTAWFHRFDPHSEWLLCDHESPVAQGGLMGTTARIWSRDRRLLASGGAQLLCVPAQPHP